MCPTFVYILCKSKIKIFCQLIYQDLDIINRCYAKQLQTSIKDNINHYKWSDILQSTFELWFSCHSWFHSNILSRYLLMWKGLSTDHQHSTFLTHLDGLQAKPSFCIIRRFSPVDGLFQQKWISPIIAQSNYYRSFNQQYTHGRLAVLFYNWILPHMPL